MSRPKDISADLTKLAQKIAKEALECEDRDYRLEAFKQLTTFYVGTARVSGKVDDEDKAPPKAETWRQRINGGLVATDAQ